MKIEPIQTEKVTYQSVVHQSQKQKLICEIQAPIPSFCVDQVDSDDLVVVNPDADVLDEEDLVRQQSTPMRLRQNEGISGATAVRNIHSATRQLEPIVSERAPISSMQDYSGFPQKQRNEQKNSRNNSVASTRSSTQIPLPAFNARCDRFKNGLFGDYYSHNDFAAVVKEDKESLNLKEAPKCISQINGPILLTAPHSCQIKRGDAKLGHRERTHLREHWASTITLMLAQAIEDLQGEMRDRKQSLSTNSSDEENNKSKIEASYVVWNKDRPYDKKNDMRLDPNYLAESQFEHSSFHQCLHKFVQENENMPMLHIDIHGKKDRKNNSDIDLGIKAISESFAPEDQVKLVQPLIKKLSKKMTQIFARDKINGFKVMCNPEGELQGRWPEAETEEQKKVQVFTMTQQSVQMGIPALQIELPRSVRNQIMLSPQKYIREMAKAILDTYRQVIVPAWQAKETKLQTPSAELAAKVNVMSQDYNTKDLAAEYRHWDRLSFKNLI